MGGHPPASAPGKKALKPVSLINAILTALIILTLDVSMGSPTLSAVTAFFCVTAGWIWVLMASKERTVWVTRLRFLAIVFPVAAIVLGYWIYDGRQARARVVAVAESLNDYKARHGSYPDKLDVLVPDYFPAVPKAHSWGMSSRISYFRDSNGVVQLMYVSIPPFGRDLLDVETGKWSRLD